MNVFLRLELSFFLIIIYVWPSIYAISNPQDLYQLIDTGREEVYHFRLEKALEIFRSIQHKYPDHPHGYFYESYIIGIYYSQDQTNPKIDSLLHLTVSKSVEIAEEYKRKNPLDAESMYYLGVSHGVLGIYHVLNRNYIRGYIHGRRGKNYLEDVVQTDSTYYDAYLGLGIFHYYVDLLPGVIKFFASILGFHGDREQGIREIKLTAQKGRLFNVEADFTQATIRYILEGDKRTSLRDFQRLHKEYPQNPAFTLMIGYHYRRQGQIKTALKYFNTISDIYGESLPQIEIMKYYHLGVSYYRLNDFEKSEFCFNRILNHSIRKSRYFQAALAYYKGLLAGIRFDENSSRRYFKMIIKHKDTRYWYNISRMYIKNPIDTTMREFIIANNNVYIANISVAKNQVKKLVELLEENKDLSKTHLNYLIKDLNARLAFRQGKIEESQHIYKSFIENLDDFVDEFHRSWIYINYARVLRELKLLKESRDILEKATTDDEYTRVIIERERFILKNLMKQTKT